MPQNTNVKRTPKKRWFLLIILLFMMVVGAYYWSQPSQSDQDVQTTADVTIGDIEENVTAQGKLEAKEYVDVGAQITGQLQKIYVDIGDEVTIGQLLAEIDPRVYAAKVQADEANIKNLQAQLAGQAAQIVFAYQQFERNRGLMKSKVVSEQDFQNSDFSLKKAVATADSLKAQIEQVQSTLIGNRTNLGYAKIFAPMDGTVVMRPARLGQTLNANQTTPTILQLAKLDAMTVRAQVAEADVMRLKKDLLVYFTTLGSERRWQGKVRQILPSPELINNVVLYNVLVDVDNRGRQLMTGMSTQMFFVLGKAEKVPLAPISVLGARQPAQDNEMGKAYLVKQQIADAVEEKTVHVGLQNRRFAEIRDGVATGDKLLVIQRQKEKSHASSNDRGYPTTGKPRL